MEEEIILPLGGRLWLAEGPDDPKGTVLICPGGAYEMLSPREAQPVARAFVKKGWAAAVLFYAIRTQESQPPLGDLPLRQLGQAAGFLRERGCGKLVLCGFSAGGHLAASLGVHWERMGFPRPDGLILCYPVISAGAYAHEGSFRNLAGAGDRSIWSLEDHVGRQVPPCFLWHTVTDPDVPVQNSLLFAQKLSAAGVRYEMHLYPRGVHGLSLATPEVDQPEKGRLADPHIAGWMDLCGAWLESLD
jgi:acetyl esterase/lipase